MFNSKSKLIIAGLALAMVPSITFAKSLEDRVSELEANQSLNIFHFSGDLETLYDNIYSQHDSNTNPFFPSYYGNPNYLRLWASLNVNADVSSRIKFYSRLTATKFMNNTNGNTQSGTLHDLGDARSETGSQLYLERAYADIHLTDSNDWVFSFGRLPTTDGPFTHYHYSQARMGTYPTLAYASELDGFALSYNHDLSGATASARLIYTPLSSVPVQNAALPNYQYTTQVGNDRFPTLNNLAALMLEYDRPNLSFGGHLDVMYLGILSGNLYVDGTQAPFSGSGYSRLNFQIHNVTAEYDNVLGSQFDLGLSYLYTTYGNSGPGITAAAVGGYSQGYGNKHSASDSAVLAVARYHVFNPTYLGFEYMHGGKDALLFGNINAEDLTGFYATTGDAYNLYVVQNLTKELVLRVGYSRQNYQYTALGLTASQGSDQTVDTWYGRLRLDF